MTCCMLFGGQNYAVIATREGKETLRTADTRRGPQDRRRAPAANPRSVEAVYFTSFVMQ